MHPHYRKAITLYSRPLRHGQEVLESFHVGVEGSLSHHWHAREFQSTLGLNRS